MSQAKALEIVEVTWVDSFATGGWKPRTEYLTQGDDHLCHSVGYLVRRDSRRVTIVQSHATSGNCADSISIPREAVKEIRVLG